MNKGQIGSMGSMGNAVRPGNISPMGNANSAQAKLSGGRGEGYRDVMQRSRLRAQQQGQKQPAAAMSGYSEEIRTVEREVGAFFEAQKGAEEERKRKCDRAKREESIIAGEMQTLRDNVTHTLPSHHYGSPYVREIVRIQWNPNETYEELVGRIAMRFARLQVLHDLELDDKILAKASSSEMSRFEEMYARKYVLLEKFETRMLTKKKQEQEQSKMGKK